jgi:carboxyl-terminal processing protease
MKNIILGFTTLFVFNCYSQVNTINKEEIREDLNEIINDISQNYVYLNDKNVSLKCIKDYYSSQIKNLQTEEETVLFFEYLIDEFYDSHLNLGTHRPSSFRLYTTIYASISNGKPIISNVWQTQIQNLKENIVGAEILKFNGIDFQQMIKVFPTNCNDKNNPEVREWITNKILAGRYNEPRNLTLRLSNNKRIELDIDAIKLKENTDLLSVKTIDDIGIIRINNSLGNDDLVNEFDNSLDDLFQTKGIIIDLRNTINGGDSYEARGIMSRFITEKRPYQQHAFMEKSEGNPDIERNWIEYVTPRGKTYKKPVVVLVGRWTGSMGEGLAIGFEGINRGEIVGTEMRRLAGEVFDFGFRHQKYGYKLSAAKLYHLNGTLREKYIPTNYVKQTTIAQDEILDKGIELITKSSLQTDSILRKELELIGTEDQTLRLLLPEVEEKFGRESDEKKYVWSLINRQDSICVNKVIKIVDTHGWVAKSRIGTQANQAIWLVMQHAELKVQEKYLPLLKESVEKGESEEWQLAFFEDRILMYNKKEQIYGTQAIWDDDLKKNKIYPIADVKNVNQRRKKLGLEPIEVYAKSNGYIFDQRK